MHFYRSLACGEYRVDRVEYLHGSQCRCLCLRFMHVHRPCPGTRRRPELLAICLSERDHSLRTSRHTVTRVQADIHGKNDGNLTELVGSQQSHSRKLLSWLLGRPKLAVMRNCLLRTLQQMRLTVDLKVARAVSDCKGGK